MLTTALSAIGVAIQAVMPFFGALVQVGGSILEALQSGIRQFAQMFTEPRRVSEDGSGDWGIL
ncbi:hypothetical protein P7H06_22380 [Paenibacillus larvae]|nr:hypothetical protein [Paenibacillus larvae]MDT2261696.1 hypothetical protein [Paenibacillus larvae]